MKKKLKDASDVYDIEVKNSSDELTVTWNENHLQLKKIPIADNEFLLNLDGRTIRAYTVKDKDRIIVHIKGKTWVFNDVTDQVGSAISGGTGGGADSVVSPMPGSVIKLLVESGEAVRENQPLVIVEAMKMENEVLAPSDAVVDKILVEAGQQVGAGEALITFAQPDEDAK